MTDVGHCTWLSCWFEVQVGALWLCAVSSLWSLVGKGRGPGCRLLGAVAVGILLWPGLWSQPFGAVARTSVLPRKLCPPVTVLLGQRVTKDTGKVPSLALLVSLVPLGPGAGGARV